MVGQTRGIYAPKGYGTGLISLIISFLNRALTGIGGGERIKLRFICNGEGDLEEDQGGGKLPGVVQLGRGEDTAATFPTYDHDVPMIEGMIEVETAALEEVLGEGVEDHVQGAGFPPEAEAAIAGLVGGVAFGQVGPWRRMADLPQDGIQDGAGIEGRPAAHGGTGRGGRVAFVDDGLDEHPLQVGEVHGGG